MASVMSTPTAERVDVGRIITHTTAQVTMRYRRWVDRDDLTQHIHLYLLGEGRHAAKKATTVGQMHRLLRGVATEFAEREKAVKSGYSPDDVCWYSKELLGDVLIPLALDDTFDGMTSDGESLSATQSLGLVTMVVDVRRAIKAVGADLVHVHAFLGGQNTTDTGTILGRRRVVSNASAQSITRQTEVSGVSFGRDNG
jgi:hypothetical protein